MHLPRLITGLYARPSLRIITTLLCMGPLSCRVVGCESIRFALHFGRPADAQLPILEIQKLVLAEHKTLPIIFYMVTLENDARIMPSGVQERAITSQ